jgi:hypothetical protein
MIERRTTLSSISTVSSPLRKTVEGEDAVDVDRDRYEHQPRQRSRGPCGGNEHSDGS